jgi:hypothetical protein
MIRPLYRWKSFWFGVLFIAFLGWGWVRSIYMNDFLMWMPKDLDFNGSFGQSRGSFRVGWSYSPAPPDLPIFEWRSYTPARSSERLFPRAFNWNIYPSSIGIWLSHWFLILLFLVPWSGWLAWRWRRLSRLHKDHKSQPES